MIHEVVVLGYMELHEIVSPGVDDGLAQKGLDSIDTNRNGEFHSRNDVEGGLAWLQLTK